MIMSQDPNIVITIFLQHNNYIRKLALFYRCPAQIQYITFLPYDMIYTTNSA